MRIGVLTSSRADFGIYLPLLKKMKSDNFFDMEIIAFGTHLSEKYGYTKKDILKSGFNISHEINTVFDGDSPQDINHSIAKTIIEFSNFWSENSSYDIVLCLGDRYEMFAAVMSGVPFNISFAHIHAGEKTLGAIDNIYRHSISHASRIHFTSTDEYSKRVNELIDVETKKIVTVGALSLDTLENFNPLSLEEFEERFKINLSLPTVLITFHPETINYDENANSTLEIVKAIQNFPSKQFLITMPNADTYGNVIRKIFLQKLSNNQNVKLIENLGTIGYFSAMYYSEMLLGNTSSGIIEAASFKKYVINLGKRQKGRLRSNNVFDCELEATCITTLVNKIASMSPFDGTNIYFKGGATDTVIKTLKLQ